MTGDSVKASTIATLTALISIVLTSTGAYVVRNWEQDTSAAQRLVRLETIAEGNLTSIAALISHEEALTRQVQELSVICARLTALVEGSRGR